MYKENSPSSLITVELFNASAVRLLIYLLQISWITGWHELQNKGLSAVIDAGVKNLEGIGPN